MQVLLGLPATPAIDMWSAGCVLVELFAGVPPFRGNDSFDQMKVLPVSSAYMCTAYMVKSIIKSPKLGCCVPGR